MDRVQEVYTPQLITANGAYTLKQSKIIGGFICTATGTIAITDPDGNSVLAATAVTAGVTTYLGMEFSKSGAAVTLASSAAGTLLIR